MAVHSRWQEERRRFEAMAAFIRSRLIKTVTIGQEPPFLALAETAVRFNNTSWFWADDNAKAAEMLCEPELYNANKVPGDAAIDFVLRMSPDTVIRRRCGPAELRVVSEEPQAFRVETAFFIIEGDLTRGIIRHALRFNDGRTATVAEHTGNHISFRHGWRQTRIDTESCIDNYQIQQDADSVVLSYSCRLTQPGPWWRRGGATLGKMIYRCEISALKPSISVSAEIVPMPGITLRDVTVALAVDQLSQAPGVDYRAIAVRGAQGEHFHRNIPDAQTALPTGPLEYCGLIQEGASPGFSYALHTLLENGDRVSDVLVRGQQDGRLHWVAHRYTVGDVSAEAPVRITEKRMLTGGGYYDAPRHYAAVLRHDLGGGHDDPSMTYDIGAELNAVATHILFAHSGQYTEPPEPARLRELTTWYDRHVQRYFDVVRPGAPSDIDRVFSRGLAFVVLSLDCMIRATGRAEYRELMAAGAALILRLQSQKDVERDPYTGTFGDSWAGQAPFLDNHAACVLALVRAAWHGDPDGVLGAAVRAGILAIRLHSGSVVMGANQQQAYDGLAVLQWREHGLHTDTGFWNYKLGLVLRALHATRTAMRVRALAEGLVDQSGLELRIRMAEELLEDSTRQHDAMLEVLTSRISGETNSETQPWVALGLVPVVDERIVRLGGLLREAPPYFHSNCKGIPTMMVDHELLARHRAPDDELVAEEGCFTNWLGLKTDASLFGSADQIRGQVFAELPTGGDGVYGSYSKYAAFLMAIEQANDKARFNAVELGAGWGPWISGVGKVCQRAGFAHIALRGVEADAEKCQLMREHFERNGLVGQAIHGAVWHEDVPLHFPSVHRQDHGAAVSTVAAGKDYRGFDQHYIAVPAYSLEKICEDWSIVDYIHCDILGAELAVARSAIVWLNTRVKFLFVATHSRRNEGELVELFHEHGWNILYQHPCHFEYDARVPTLAGMTKADGALFLRNPRFVPAVY